MADWTPVVLRRRPTTTKDGKRTGAPTKIVAKTVTNEKSHLVALERRIDNGEAIVKKRLSSDSLRIMVGARIAKKLTQEQLDQLCGFPKHSVREFEAGRRVPNGKEIGLISRHLGGVRIHLEEV